MTTYLIMHQEEDSAYRSIDGIVPATAMDPVVWGKTWCQADANARAGWDLPLMTWERTLGRGWGTAAGGGTHRTRCLQTQTRYWVVATDELKITDYTENTAIAIANSWECSNCGREHTGAVTYCVQQP